MKMLKPGVSSRLILVFFHSTNGERGGDRDLALDLLVVEVGDGVALIHASKPVGGPGGVQECRRRATSCRSRRVRSDRRSECPCLRKLSLWMLPSHELDADDPEPVCRTWNAQLKPVHRGRPAPRSGKPLGILRERRKTLQSLDRSTDRTPESGTSHGRGGPALRSSYFPCGCRPASTAWASEFASVSNSTGGGV